MTKKDYIAFAKIVSDWRTHYSKNGITHFEPGEVLERITVQMAEIFEKDNSRFNREKFFTACMPSR